MWEADKVTMGKFRIDESNKDLINDLFRYFLGMEGKLDTSKGLWLEGPVGTGKSTLMRVFSSFMRGLGDGFKVKICSEVAAEYAMTGNLDTYLLNREGYSGCPVPFCFDELGREPMPTKYFGTDLNVFQHILHIRYSLWQESGLKTFLTTNLTVSDVEKLYGDYIRDRRREMFNVIVVGGESRRK